MINPSTKPSKPRYVFRAHFDSPQALPHAILTARGAHAAFQAAAGATARRQRAGPRHW